MYSPEISVIIPVYNAAATIQDTVNSALTQTFTNFELIIVNDGSTDSTPIAISTIKDSRIKVFTYANAGANVSRNRGLSHSVGTFVSFLDADDLWKPDKLAKQLQALEQNPQASVAYSWTDYIDHEGKVLVKGTHLSHCGDVYQKLIISNFVENGSNPLILKSAIIKLNGFDESLDAAQDLDMWLRLARHFKFVSVEQVQIYYRVTPNSISSDLDRQEKACILVLNRACRFGISDRIKRMAIANMYKYLTCKALLFKPTRLQGLMAAKFFCKYIVNDLSRDRLKFKIIISLKILLIIFLWYPIFPRREKS